jgi:hypothetical protein
MKKYQVVSPDNIPITCDGAIFRSLKQARIALTKWTENYQAQGYYSQVCYNGYVRQIPLECLADYCEIKTI